jgi:LacI family transcriptional regulator
MPYILVDRELPGLTANFVGINDETAGRIATEHLIEQGCKTIAHICGRENSTGMKRLEGYRRALKTAGIPYLESLVIARSKVDINSERMGAEAMCQLLKQRPIPDGVFAHNDPLAFGAVEAIFEAGLRIPEDIAVVGCGNLHYDSLLRVPLSSVDQNNQAIGEKCAEILLEILESKKRPQLRSIILEPSLVIRASSQKKH